MTAFRRFVSTPRLLVVGLFVLLGSCSRQPETVTARAAPPIPRTESAPLTPTVTSGPGVVTMMHERYKSTWYESFTFTQKTTVPMTGGGDLVQTWYEAGMLPGQLRIDTNLDTKSGVLYARDSVYRFADGKLTRADTGINELLVLGFDVYKQSPTETEAQLRRLGFNLGVMHQTTWEGKPVYVVGAALGDTTSKQFWVDKDRLLFVRMLQQNPKRGQIDVRFANYERAGKAWMAMRVEQFVGGKRTLLEEYSDVKTDVTLSANLFDPKQWGSVPHWIAVK